LQYRLLNQNNNAIKCLLKANEIQETDITWTMLGGCYAEMKDYKKAEQCFLKALEINPNFDGAHMDLATVYHMAGQTERAWPFYEHRVNVYPQLQIFKKIYEPNKKWNGTIYPKMRLLIHAEQGFGDTIQFSRYLPLLKEKGIYTIFHCDESLAELISPLVDELYLTDPVSMPTYADRDKFEIPTYDYHCSLLSLPFLLNNPKIPNPPYLKTNDKFNFDVYKNNYKIGLIWAGNPMHPNDENRSCYLKYFRPLQEISNVKLFSLMKDIRPRKYKHKADLVDYAEDTNDMHIIDLGPYLNNFIDTARIIEGLDLVVSVDSAVLHLAGALNKKAYALISYDNDWRWQTSGTDSIWYPSIKLFRQEQKGDWETPINKIVENLKTQKNQQS
jgi:tetratricopeptide (TPR) repeat protein